MTTFNFGTTTPLEWVALARVSDETLWLEQFPMNGTCDTAQASDLSITSVAKDLRDAATKAANKEAVGGGMWAYTSIARRGDNVKLSTFAWLQNGSRMRYKIAGLAADPNAPYPSSVQLVAVSGHNDDSLLLHGSLVEAPPGTLADLFYYRELVPGPPSAFQIGFRVHGEGSIVGSGVLTVTNGQPYTWEYEDVFRGDYMGGASYQTEDDSVVFVMPWSQNGGLYYNTVTLKLGPVSSDVEYLAEPLEVVPIPVDDPVIAGPDGFAEDPQPGAVDPISRGQTEAEH